MNAADARCHPVNTGSRPLPVPDGEPELVYEVGGLQLWRRGRVAATMPALNRSWPHRLRTAWHARLEANLNLVCPACSGVARGRPPLTVYLDHAADCDASDEAFARLLEGAA